VILFCDCTQDVSNIGAPQYRSHSSDRALSHPSRGQRAAQVDAGRASLDRLGPEIQARLRNVGVFQKAGPSRSRRVSFSRLANLATAIADADHGTNRKDLAVVNTEIPLRVRWNIDDSVRHRRK
jgi:hypothetical protein